MKDLRIGLLHIFNVYTAICYKTAGMHQVFVIELSSLTYINIFSMSCGLEVLIVVILFHLGMEQNDSLVYIVTIPGL